MHYYQFSIGDYRAATAHLSNDEDLAYRRLLDMYYDTEQKIPLDTQWVSRRLRVDAHVVRDVLNDMFVRHEDGWYHARCADVIEQYHAMAEKNRANGRLGGRKKNPVASDSQPIAKATINHEQVNQEPFVDAPPVGKAKGKRLSPDWQLPKAWGEWTLETMGWETATVRLEAEKFRDYWVAISGRNAAKLDWEATWRNWCRNAKVQATPQTSLLAGGI